MFLLCLYITNVAVVFLGHEGHLYICSQQQIYPFSNNSDLGKFGSVCWPSQTSPQSNIYRIGYPGQTNKYKKKVAFFFLLFLTGLRRREERKNPASKPNKRVWVESATRNSLVIDSPDQGT